MTDKTTKTDDTEDGLAVSRRPIDKALLRREGRRSARPLHEQP